MQIEVETLSGLERRMSVAVPTQEFESEVDTRLRRMARTVRMHGFRPGKVPFKLVAQQYGDQVRQEVLGDQVRKRFTDAVREQKLRIAGLPRFETLPPEPDGGIRFSATFEVYPEVSLGALEGIAVERPVHPVDDADLDKTLDVLRKQRVSYEPASRAAANGDLVTMDFRGTVDGEVLPGTQGTDFQVVLGEGRLLADFETNVVGASAGDTRSFDVKFPDDYQGSDVAGKTVAFQVTVKAVAEPRLPEVDGEFAKALGVEDGDVARLRQDIRDNVSREVEKRIRARVKEQLMNALHDSTPVDLPRALVEGEAQRLAAQAQSDLRARGIPEGSLTFGPEAFTEGAQRRVKLGLLVGEMVKTHKLEAKPEQVRALIESFSDSYERPEEVVRWYYQNPDRLAEVEGLAVEENVVEWLLARASVKEVPVGFDDLMGAGK